MFEQFFVINPGVFMICLYSIVMLLCLLIYAVGANGRQEKDLREFGSWVAGFVLIISVVFGSVFVSLFSSGDLKQNTQIERVEK